MKDYSKSASNLGEGIRRELFGSDEAVVPTLRELMIGQPAEVTDRIAKQWGIVGTSFPRSLGTLFSSSANAITHLDQWKFTLRAAQCAALADRRLQARLVSSPNAADDPRAVVLQTIHKIGTGAIGLLESVTGIDLREDSTRRPEGWPKEVMKEKVPQLCMKPFVVVKVMAGFADLSLTEKPPENPHDSMEALFRLGTVAAVLGHELHIEFVSFSHPADETLVGQQR